MIDFSAIFNRSKPKIETLKVFDKTKDYFAPGALLYLEKGKGLIYDFFTECRDDKKSFLTLMFGDKTLFQLQGDEYYCPTCEKIVKTGYNLEQSKEFSFDAINSDTATFSEVLEQIMPLVGLLEDGYYYIWDTELYPTDGSGNLFWDYPNDDTVKPGSCTYYIGAGYWGSEEPHYTVATEPFEKCNKERVEYYRQHPGARAIAYYMDGNITALLDGHHKAMAAALDHRSFKAVVISACHVYELKPRSGNGKPKRYIFANGIRIEAPKEWVNSERLKKIKDKKHASVIIDALDVSEGHVVGDAYPAKELAMYYPGAAQLACVDSFEEINDELIDEFIHKADAGDTLRLIKALGIMRSERFLETVNYVLKHYVDNGVLIDTVDALVDWEERSKALGEDAASEIRDKLGADNVQDYLISYMTEIEDEKPIVGKHIFEVV